MKILLVEDDKRVASFISRSLREERFVMDEAADGERALFMAQTGEYDLIILDLMLPKRSGMEVLRTLRDDGAITPILILTAKDEVESKVKGLEAGADDYLTKPFRFEELLARIRVLMRRRGDMAPAVLRLADLEMDTLRHRVTRGGEGILLTAREYALLEYLLRHANQVVTRALLAENVWEHDFDTFSNVIEVLIGRLRKKIDEPFFPKLLHTVRGSGYILNIPGESGE